MKQKFILIPLPILILLCVAGLETWFAFLMFPAMALIIYYLKAEAALSMGNRILIIASCMFLSFMFRIYLENGEFAIVRSLIFSIVIMGAFEAWSYILQKIPNLWGLMNLVVFYLGLEYLMIAWLPYNVQPWLLGEPFFDNEYLSAYILYTGYQGFTLWIWVTSIVLFRAFDNGFNIFLFLLGLALIILPVVFAPGVSENTTLYAQGEWIGRVCIWVSLFIVGFSFVRRKTK